MQWGYVSTNGSCNFPTAFSNTNYALTFGLHITGDSYAPEYKSRTSTSFEYYCISNRPSSWIAIGY